MNKQIYNYHNQGVYITTTIRVDQRSSTTISVYIDPRKLPYFEDMKEKHLAFLHLEKCRSL